MPWPPSFQNTVIDFYIQARRVQSVSSRLTIKLIIAGGKRGAKEKFAALEAAGVQVSRSLTPLGATMMEAMGLEMPEKTT